MLEFGVIEYHPGTSLRLWSFDTARAARRLRMTTNKEELRCCLMFRGHRAQSVRFAVQYALAEELIDAVAGVAEQARQHGFVVLAERGRLEFEFRGEA